MKVLHSSAPESAIEDIYHVIEEELKCDVSFFVGCLNSLFDDLFVEKNYMLTLSAPSQFSAKKKKSFLRNLLATLVFMLERKISSSLF